jgi:hypothetical protein
MAGRDGYRPVMMTCAGKNLSKAASALTLAIGSI